MERSVWQKTATDEAGNILEGAQVTVNIQDGGLATIYSAQSGGVPIANPFLTGSDGIARFYAYPGFYSVTLFKDGQQVTFPWNNLGDNNLRQQVAIEFNTFADMQASELPEGRKAVCRERANAEYIVQASGYTALAGDVTFANGLVGALQLSGPANIKWFGAKGNGSTNDTANIQAALDRYRNLFFPEGNYIHNTLIIRNDNAKITGQPGVFFTNLSPSENGIHIRKDNYLDGFVISATVIENILMIKQTGETITGGFGILESGGSSTRLENVLIYDYPYGLTKEGCVNTISNNVKTLYGVRDINLVSDSYGLKMTSLVYNSGSKFAGFTHLFNSCVFSGANATRTPASGIVFEDCDVVNFVNCYLGRHTDQTILVQSKPGQICSVSAVYFSNTYLDGVALAENRDCVRMPADANVSVKGFSFNNCIFGQYKDVFITNNTNVRGLHVAGQAFFITGSVAKCTGLQQANFELECFNINITGAESESLLFNGGGTISVDVKATNIINGNLIRLEGSINTVDVDVNTYDGYTNTEVINNATINRIINMPKVSFIVPFTIGGSSTGITYSARQGSYSVSNGTVLLNAYLALTSKGGLSGALAIESPIFSTQFFCTGTVFLNDVVGTVTNNSNISVIDDTTINIRSGNGTSMINLTGADIKNTSIIVVDIQYKGV